MARCEGYYKLQNRRCDREGAREIRAADGELYLVCAYHARHIWTATVARWNGQTAIRASAPADLKSKPPPPAFVA